MPAIGPPMRARLQRLVHRGLRREVRQDKLLRRLSALWERRSVEERSTFLRLLATEFGTGDEQLLAARTALDSAAAAPAGGEDGAREAALRAGST